ncbi:hypothetical protein AVEN_1239-1 [Araneus ventricosus]|uniref:Uncharacterized protein n=1 Tax=Araneus ventricosus TaxID=182803 RepID=A0A4Y2K4A8_ARAVE|nr:hypothetical protein AVEN_1239-1 [Araneus ventricosus]
MLAYIKGLRILCVDVVIKVDRCGSVMWIEADRDRSDAAIELCWQEWVNKDRFRRQSDSRSRDTVEHEDAATSLAFSRLDLWRPADSNRFTDQQPSFNQFFQLFLILGIFLTHGGRPTRQGVTHYKGRRGKRANHSPGRNKRAQSPETALFLAPVMVNKWIFAYSHASVLVGCKGCRTIAIYAHAATADRLYLTLPLRNECQVMQCQECIWEDVPHRLAHLPNISFKAAFLRPIFPRTSSAVRVITPRRNRKNAGLQVHQFFPALWR